MGWLESTLDGCLVAGTTPVQGGASNSANLLERLLPMNPSTTLPPFCPFLPLFLANWFRACGAPR